MPTRVIIGWDTEYQEVDPVGMGRPNPLVFKGPNKRGGHKSPEARSVEKFNEVLAYTVCVLNPATGARTTSCIDAWSDTGLGDGPFADWRKRLKMMNLIAAAIAGGIGDGTIPADPDGYSVIFAAHYTAADLPALSDFEELTQSRARYFQTVRKTYATLERPMKRSVRILGLGHRVPVSVRLVDTMLWAPQTHKSVSKLGDALGLPKIVLPQGAIRNMRQLLIDDPDLFRAYAIRDAEVAALYAHRFLQFTRDTLRLGSKVPVTASGAGVSFAVSALEASGMPIHQVVGRDEDGEYLPRAVVVNHKAAEAFHGARNETFWIGPSPEDTPLYDWDLPSCYLTTLSMVGMPLWDQAEETVDLSRLATMDHMTYANVDFSFPLDTRFPCLPTRGGENEGLFYPISGNSWCTGPELVVALQLGAKINVISGVVLPMDMTRRPFFDVLEMLQGIRTMESRAGRKGSVEERGAKEIANSLYGQIARTVSGMRLGGKRIRGIDLHDGSRPEIPESAITSPAIAAHVTGIARAVVSELINGLPRDTAIISVTTDGFLSSAKFEDIDISGPAMTAFMDARHLLVPGDAPLELKHTAQRVLSIRTRGAFSIDGDRSEAPLMARAGNKMDEDDLISLVERELTSNEAAWAENDYWLRMAVEREYGTKVKRGRLRSIMEQWELRGGDLTRKEMSVSVALEYDHKRMIMDPVTEWNGLFGAPTVPWMTASDAHNARASFKLWRHGQQRVLKTPTDLDDYRRFAACKKPKATGRAARPDANIDALRSAAVHGTFGLIGTSEGASDLEAGRWSIVDMAKLLTYAGYPTTKYQLYRRAQKPPLEVAPDVWDVIAVLAALEDVEEEIWDENPNPLRVFDEAVRLEPWSETVKKLRDINVHSGFLIQFVSPIYMERELPNCELDPEDTQFTAGDREDG
ncbi:hypothetical protein GS636_21485 [Ruegeria sp. HKCCD4884]|uniref:hypothetical protein n=1 Tax=Ruegeria sp. HKCCD4884 TaxID=2683022 RepID=UPI001491BA51|nr:hypothetical protein [Ruegeria sp. HKCCD4884]NOD95379.1 hypothetical protein [Ruegeria sp. HKCCD4884]